MASIELEQPCPMCGTPVMVTAKECSFCGESLKHHFQLNEEEIRAELVQKYRIEMRALTGFFLMVGAIASGAGGLMLKASLPLRYELTIESLLQPAGAAFLLLCGLGWIACGCASALKKMPAVKAGLIICFPVLVALAGCFHVCVAICGVFFVVPVIMQCNRVQKISRKMQAAGVPLNYKL